MSVSSLGEVRTLEACPKPELLLSFDFDGTLHHPSESPAVPSAFFETIRKLRNDKGAIWGINTGRSLPQVLDGLLEVRAPFLPDWVVAREREIHFPNAFGRFAPHKEWNSRCEKALKNLFKRSGKVLRWIRAEVEEHTGAEYIEIEGEPAGLISRTEEEMEWIVQHISPKVAELPGFGWQRNSIYLRFGHCEFQKGSALTELTRLYELEKDKVFAMGDSHNDLEMLSEVHSGVAACPNNSVRAVRDVVEKRGGLITRKCYGMGVVEALEAHYLPS